MAPEDKLTNFVLGRELKLSRTYAFKMGYVWECEKLRSKGEACPKCASLCSRRCGRVVVCRPLGVSHRH